MPVKPNQPVRRKPPTPTPSVASGSPPPASSAPGAVDPDWREYWKNAPILDDKPRPRITGIEEKIEAPVDPIALVTAINDGWLKLVGRLLETTASLAWLDARLAAHPDLIRDLTVDQVRSWLQWANTKVSEASLLIPGGDNAKTLAAALREAAEDIESGRAFQPPKTTVAPSATSFGTPGAGPRRLRPIVPGA